MNRKFAMDRKHLCVVFLTCLYFIYFIQSGKVFASGTIRIACIGNSITYGYGVVNRAKNCYPAQLQALLGENYEVSNFGVSGATLLKRGNAPYWATPEYKLALESKPDIVFIKLGSNDSKLINRPYYREFEDNYKDLIRSFAELPTHPRIILLLPVPSFDTDTSQIWDEIITGRIIPMIQQLAYDTKTEVIDLHSLFQGRGWMFPDKVHPTSLGAAIIARRCYEEILRKEITPFDIFTKVDSEKTFTSFFGFECAGFIYNGRDCKIVKPRHPASGLPWVWRARFWGHEPQTDIALLERGFHVVYCDVAELFGNLEAVSLWNDFYGFLVTSGLSSKPALEGMSRGGMYIYNWALANPGKVACIYADAPVLDMKSWPGGFGISPGDPTSWNIFKADFGLQNDLDAMNFRGNPLDNASAIARLGFPMLHVVGDADSIVPVEENTAPFEKAVKEAGGNIRVIHKPGIGHHPHSLADPTPIVDFILRATGNKLNFAAIPCPGAEYRSAAGWQEGSDWWTNADEIQKSINQQKDRFDILFLGNSITQGIGNRNKVTWSPGKEAFDRAFAGKSYVNAGISGDRTQHLAWRMKNMDFRKASPRVVVITIGVNNFPDDSPEEIAEGIRLIVTITKTKLPESKILLLGPLPTGTQKNSEYREKYTRVQELIGALPDSQNVFYFNTGSLFMTDDGTLNPLLYGDDGIHLKKEGYRVWVESLKTEFAKLPGW